MKQEAFCRRASLYLKRKSNTVQVQTTSASVSKCHLCWFRFEWVCWRQEFGVLEFCSVMNLAFDGLGAGHAAVGEDKSGDAGGRQVMNEMLHPGIVGVAGGRHAEFPAGIFAQAVAAPVAHVE